MHMTSVIQTLLILHVIAGTGAFIFAPLALATAKGGPAHRRWGNIYFWMMTVVAATALIVAPYRRNYFLALVAVFSFYAAFSGYRVLFRKRPLQGQGPKMVDWSAAIFTFLASALLFLFGLFKPAVVGNMGIVSAVFGAIGMFLGAGDLRKFLSPPADKNFWWFSHMGNMLGSYIAALTAFSAVTLSRYLGSSLFVWLWPTAIGVPGLIIWITYYKKKFGRKQTPAAVNAIADPAKGSA
jgi:hypothetical protein